MESTMTRVPTAVLFDVNETLFSMEPLCERFRRVGLTGSSDLELWFSNVLQSGFASNLAGTCVPFSEVAKHELLSLLRRVGAAHKTYTDEEAAEHVLEGLSTVKPYDDMAAAFRTLHRAGIRVALMTNGAAAVGHRLVERAGVQDVVELVMDAQEAGAWKPARAAYLHCCHRLQLEPCQVLLIAVHPWDCHGAQKAGLQAAHIRRASRGAPWPAALFKPPEVMGSSLLSVAQIITRDASSLKLDSSD